MNWSNDPHTFCIISAIVSFVRLKMFKCLQLYSHPWPLRCRCRAHMWQEPWDSPEIVRIIASIHLSTTLRKHFFHSSFLSQEHMCSIDWAGESSAPALQRSWVRVSLKTPEIFQVHISDDRWDCPECVRIIASFISQPHFTNILLPYLRLLIMEKEDPCYICNHSTIKTSIFLRFNIYYRSIYGCFVIWPHSVSQRFVRCHCTSNVCLLKTKTSWFGLENLSNQAPSLFKFKIGLTSNCNVRGVW